MHTPKHTPDPRNVELCRTLARLQAVIAEDRVTAQDDECIAACGTIINFLAQEWGLEHAFLWDSTTQHDLGANDLAWAKEEVEGINRTVDETMALVLAGVPAPTTMRSRATRSLGDAMREDGHNVTEP